MLSEQGSHKRPYIISFYLHEIPRIGKSTEKDEWLPRAEKCWGKMELTATEFRVSFGGDRNILKDCNYGCTIL